MHELHACSIQEPHPLKFCRHTGLTVVLAEISSKNLTMTSNVSSDWGSLILHRVNLTKREIGRGAYGRVFEVDYEGTLCAAKEVHEILLQCAQGSDLQKIKDDFLGECQIWSTLRHPCVVQFLGSVILKYIRVHLITFPLLQEEPL